VTDSYRVFLSHSSKDKEFVRELYRRLTRDGVSCFFDAESIGWGANWVKALERDRRVTGVGTPRGQRGRVVRVSKPFSGSAVSGLDQ
jgi:hypothetical protein